MATPTPAAGTSTTSTPVAGSASSITGTPAVTTLSTSTAVVGTTSTTTSSTGGTSNTLADVAAYAPLDASDPGATLTVRDGLSATFETIPRSDWKINGNIVTRTATLTGAVWVPPPLAVACTTTV